MLEFTVCLIVAVLACFGLITLLKEAFLGLCADDKGEVFIVIKADGSCNDLDLKIYEALGRAHMAGGAAKIVVLDYGMSEQMSKIAHYAAENNGIVIIKSIDELKKIV